MIAEKQDRQERPLRLDVRTQMAPRPEEPHAVPADGATALTGEVSDPLDEAAARELTDRIKTTTQQVCMLLLEAHARRAWVALGYQSWEQYVHAEFGLSRSRSYQLLDQGRVIVVITSTAGLSGSLDIHPYAAAQLKRRLPEIVETVRSQTAGRSEAEARTIVNQVIDAHRQSVRVRVQKRAGRGDARLDLTPLFQAISGLATMPSPIDAASWVTADDDHRLAGLHDAVDWLTTFRREWERLRSSDQPAPTLAQQA